MSRQQRLFQDALSDEKSDLSLYSEAFFKKFDLPREPKSLGEIGKAFLALKEEINRGDLLASLIGKYIYDHISKVEIRKRRVTARDFEEFLTRFFQGEIIEAEQRDQYLKELPGTDEFSRRVSRNRLEKLDVRLGSILLSVKTFVPTNKELNAGSFSAEALFDGFLPLPIPSERTDLGSGRALTEKFLRIHKDGKWGAFVERYERMVNIIYRTEWIFAIKGGRYFDIYLLPGSKFRELMISCVRAGPSKATRLLNRFEAHAIRTQTDPLFSESQHIRIDLIGPAAKRLRIVDSFISDVKSIAIAVLCGNIKVQQAKENFVQKVGEFIKEIS